MTSRMLIIMWCDATKDITAHVIYPKPHSDSGCQVVARGLSPEPHGRFCSFLAGKVIWLSRHHRQNFNTIRSISELWECFPLPWQHIWILSKFNYAMTLSYPLWMSVPDFVETRWETPEEKPNKDTKISSIMIWLGHCLVGPHLTYTQTNW